MKKLVLMMFFALFSYAYAATSYIIVEEGISLPLGQITLFNGTPVEVISSSASTSKVVIKGFMDPKDPKSIYATKNLKLLFAQVQDSASIQKNGEEVRLEIDVSKKNLVDNADLAWEKSTDKFYEKCTKCHAAKVVGHHTMLEWEGLYGSMKEFAKPTEEESAHILRFLRAYAKDGILSE